MKTYRKMFLEPNLIAVEPHKGWRRNQQNQSLEAIQWLEFENFKQGGGIRVSMCLVFAVHNLTWADVRPV